MPLAVLALVAAAPFLRLDVFLPGMALTYPPRTICAALLALLAVAYILRRRFGRSVLAVAAALASLAAICGGGPSPPRGPAWTVLALNTENSLDGAGQPAEFCRQHRVDLLSLQEVHEPLRERLVDLLPDYRFFAGDPRHHFEAASRQVFTCLTGIRQSLLTQEPVVHTAVTGYRTWALDLRLAGESLWIVNVHATKPIWIARPWWSVLTQAWSKARWHREERDRLEDWLRPRSAEAVLLAGDFNAPDRTYNTRLHGFTNAHGVSGSGLHLTFPRRFPVLGLDHVLGTSRIRFHAYETFDASFSDHRGQLATFSILPVAASTPYAPRE